MLKTKKKNKWTSCYFDSRKSDTGCDNFTNKNFDTGRGGRSPSPSTLLLLLYGSLNYCNKCFPSGGGLEVCESQSIKATHAKGKAQHQMLGLWSKSQRGAILHSRSPSWSYLEKCFINEARWVDSLLMSPGPARPFSVVAWALWSAHRGVDRLKKLVQRVCMCLAESWSDVVTETPPTRLTEQRLGAQKLSMWNEKYTLVYFFS